MIRLLLADDQVLFVKSLKRVIESSATDMEVVATAADGREVLKILESQQPDIILLDVRMPVLDGVETAKIVREKYPKIQIVMLTTFDNDEYVIESFQYGVVGYILKDIEPHHLISSIRAIHEGSVLISPVIAAQLFNQIRTTEGGRTEGPDLKKATLPDWARSLTPREMEVLRLLARGYNNRRIAEELFIAEQTVCNHVSVIYSKLGIHDRIATMQLVLDSESGKGSPVKDRKEDGGPAAR